jgi:hypothetical protein
LGIDAASFDVLEGDHAEVLLPWVRKAVPHNGGAGLLIHDPNGAPNFDVLERLVKDTQLKRFDVAVYVQATALKRVLNLPPGSFNTAGWLPLEQALRRVKSHWVVRTPSGSNQYALCIGTNGAIRAEWSRMRFWATDSSRGRDILEKLTFTQAERKALLQPKLFGNA